MADINKRLFLWSGEEIRHGQLWPISIALTLIVACVFALSALAERMEQIVVKQGKDALTADLVYTSSNPIPESLMNYISGESIEHASLVRYGSMAFSDTDMQLVTVKAVDISYPLRGELSLDNGVTRKGYVEQGELWLEERVFNLLQVDVGDSVTIGDADFKISGRVIQEPGLSFNPFQQMPAVYIHSKDIEKTGALQLGSRVRFNLYLQADEATAAKIKSAVKLTPSDRWMDSDSNSRNNELFERTTQYLSLTVAIVIIMAATTLVLTSQNYVSSRRKTVAMLRSLGATKGWLYRWLAMQVTLLFIVGVGFGLLLGAGLEVLLRIPLEGLLPDPLPRYGVTPFLVSLLTCTLIGIPALGIPLTKLVNTSAATVMQSQLAERKLNIRALWMILVPLVPMFIAYRENTLVWIVFAGIILLLVLLAVLSMSLIKGISRLPLSASMKLAVSRISRSSVASGLQFGALSLSLMLLAVIWLVRTDLLSDWQRTIPKDAPNAFSLNIAPYEKEAYLKFLDEKGIERSQAYPITRGRVTEINGVEAKSYQGVDKRSDSLRREINFTWAEKLPARNPVIQGRWTDTQGVSVESEIAGDLNLKLGDQLGFVINGKKTTATVNSIRSVEWREMKPNFYFIFTPDVLEKLPATWMVSYRIDDSQSRNIAKLSRTFPTVSILDVRSMGNKIQALLEQIIWSVTVLAALGVVAGIMLIFTLLRLSLSQRQNEIRLYRTLGASKKSITRTIWSEYGLMAVVAGVVATIGAELSVAGVMVWGFELGAKIHTGMWFMLPLIAFAILAITLNTLIKKLLSPIY
ncbi:ABC transporter permease [Vibrio sp. JC009]|uniref:ABC transporter permease n=1 Tax=Vibrio sp. JC009 TaxID=2912314 RepID=UPI0023AF2247|nr:FtsX-like permease family protein [Vibrio sp. JC009]WED24388.1 ABC transporter permease [Vibrio sp. JC009]